MFQGSFLGKGPANESFRPALFACGIRRTARQRGVLIIARIRDPVDASSCQITPVKPYWASHGATCGARPLYADFASGASAWSLINGCRVVHFFSVNTTCDASLFCALTTIGPRRL